MRFLGAISILAIALAGCASSDTIRYRCHNCLDDGKSHRERLNDAIKKVREQYRVDRDEE